LKNYSIHGKIGVFIKVMQTEQRVEKIKQVTLLGLVWNILLAVVKVLIGFLGNSRALLADGIHSGTDIFTDVVVILGVKTGSKPVDSTHHYGHGKFETLSALFLGMVLFGAGIGIFISGLWAIIRFYHGHAIGQPVWAAFFVALFSILVKEILYRRTLSVGKEYKSDATIANAWHHRSDAFSSLGSTTGILGAILLGENWRILDPLAAVLVSFFIMKVAIKVFWKSINELLERSLDEETEGRIMETVAATAGVLNPHGLKTREIGNRKAIDVHIEVDKDSSVVTAHDVASQVEVNLKKEFGDETLISVHVEPHEP
jgi:cation diffusion facilitator family transporter